MYRDDYDATLARVAALEQEIARDAVHDEAREKRLAGLERELVAARTQLAKAETELAKLRPERPPPVVTPTQVPVNVPPVALEGEKRSPTLAGLIIVLAVVGVIVIAIAVKQAQRRSPPAPAPQTILPDEVSRLVEEGRARAQKLLPGAFLTELDAKGVTEQGTLHTEYGELKLRFDHENPPPPEPVIDPNTPIGAPRPPAPPYDRWSCVYITRDREGWHDLDLHGLCSLSGLRTSEHDPKCTTRSIWVIARAAGARAGAIAHIRFEGSWTFEIADDRAPFNQTFDDECVTGDAKP